MGSVYFFFFFQLLTHHANVCSQAKTNHGRETREARTERSLASARLAVLEAIGHKLGFMNGTRIRGRKPDRMAKAYPFLTAALP